MSEEESAKKNLLTSAGCARRSFLKRATLASAGTSVVAVLPAIAAARSSDVKAASPIDCPDVKIPMREVEGKVAFVTGGASGIGLGMVKAFVAAGMKVVIGDINVLRIQEVLAYFTSANQSSQVHAIHADATDRRGMERAAAETVQVFGKVHALVSNAGIATLAPFSSATYEEWDRMLNVNVNGVFNGTHAFLPHIRAHGEGGHIITTSSIAGLVANGAAGYTASKFAVVGLMESLRAELAGTNIGVSSVLGRHRPKRPHKSDSDTFSTLPCS